MDEYVARIGLDCYCRNIHFFKRGVGAEGLFKGVSNNTRFLFVFFLIISSPKKYPYYVRNNILEASFP